MKFSLLPLFLLATSAAAEPFTVLSWNVESGGAEPAVISKQLAELPRADAYLLQEVAPADIGRYAAAIRQAHGQSYKYYLGSVGGADRLAMIVDEDKFKIRSFSELFSFNEHVLNDWRHRSPLVAHLMCKSDGRECLLVTVHLARGKETLRNDQAAGLREWAKEQKLPVVLAGDCNFDYDFKSGQGNAAYDEFTKGGTWSIVTPREWIDTNWSDRNGDGRDDYPDSSLDFAAVSTHDEQLEATCRVIVRAGDFPDSKATSDHRPVMTVIKTGH